MQRLRFRDVFTDNPDGTLSPIRKINVNGIVFSPGVSLGSGVALGGINFQDFRNMDIAGDELNGVFVIRGFYQP